MKNNKIILPILLILSLAAPQAQAGVWDWCTAPFKAVALYVWNSSGLVTKAHVDATVTELKAAFKKDADEAIQNSNTRTLKQEQNADAIGKNVTAADTKANDLIATQRMQIENGIRQKEEIEKQAEQRRVEVAKLEEDKKRLELEIAAMLITKAALKDDLSRMGQKAIEADSQVNAVITDASENKELSQTLEKRNQALDQRIGRIKAMVLAKPIDKTDFIKGKQFNAGQLVSSHN